MRFLPTPDFYNTDFRNETFEMTASLRGLVFVLPISALLGSGVASSYVNINTDALTCKGEKQLSTGCAGREERTQPPKATEK